jgi:hypothetical protein
VYSLRRSSGDNSHRSGTNRGVSGVSGVECLGPVCSTGHARTLGSGKGERTLSPSDRPEHWQLQAVDLRHQAAAREEWLFFPSVRHRNFLHAGEIGCNIR